MTAERPIRRTKGTRAPRRSGSAVSEPEATQQQMPEHRFVDIDPWAVLLEQLMEPAEEDPVERKGTKAK